MKLKQIFEMTAEGNFIEDWVNIIINYSDPFKAEKDLINIFSRAKKDGLGPKHLSKVMKDHMDQSDDWTLDDIKVTNKAAKKVFGIELVDTLKVD
jgi:hypothetical protein